MANRKEQHIKEQSEDEAFEHLPGSERIRRAHEDRERSRRKHVKHRERHVVKSVKATDQAGIKGKVIRTEGAYFIAKLDTGEEINAKTVKGTETQNPNSTLVTTGDNVLIDIQEEGDAIITSVLERKSKLSRRAAGRKDAFEQVIVANVDLLVIVTSAFEPPIRLGIVDRYIVAGLQGGLAIAIVINKIDLVKHAGTRDYFQGYVDLYTSLGYPTILASTITGEGIDELQHQLEGKTSVFAGHSGVGKSSLINHILEEEIGKTGPLSKKYRRGAHTTSASVLLPIPGLEGSYVVDTPGVREFANFELDSENLKFLFVEFLPLQPNCKITNCTHIHEPGCAIIEAVEQDKISVDRYTSYVKLYEEAIAEEKKIREG